MGELKNCWQVKDCGREPGGRHARELGVCPAAVCQAFTGLNRGDKGGRICWGVAGTFCEGHVQGTFAMKTDMCTECGFFMRVAEEEGDDFQLRPEERDFTTRHTVRQP